MSTQTLIVNQFVLLRISKKEEIDAKTITLILDH